MRLGARCHSRGTTRGAVRRLRPSVARGRREFADTRDHSRSRPRGLRGRHGPSGDDEARGPRPPRKRDPRFHDPRRPPRRSRRRFRAGSWWERHSHRSRQGRRPGADCGTVHLQDHAGRSRRPGGGKGSSPPRGREHRSAGARTLPPRRRRKRGAATRGDARQRQGAIGGGDSFRSRSGVRRLRALRRQPHGSQVELGSGRVESVERRRWRSALSHETVTGNGRNDSTKMKPTSAATRRRPGPISPSDTIGGGWRRNASSASSTT